MKTIVTRGPKARYIAAWANGPGFIRDKVQGARLIHAAIARSDPRAPRVQHEDCEPRLAPALRPSLHAYLAEVTRNTDCGCYRVGGVFDHVHLAITLPRTVAVATVVETVKTPSSKWIKTQSPTMSGFAGQRGYGAFPVGPSDRDALCSYIDNQEEHHRTRSFQDEYRTFLTEYGVIYDERDVWD